MVRVITPQMRNAAEDAERIIDEALPERGQEPDTLAELVQDAYRIAKRHRQNQGVEYDLEYCLKAYQCQYTDYDKQRLGIDETNNIFSPITRTKCMALMSWLADIFSNAEDKPWVIEPTPVPDLPDSLQAQIEQQLMAELMVAQQQGLQVTPDILEERAREMASLQFAEMERTARRAVDRMSRKLEDQLGEGGWRETFGQLIHDLSIYPNAFVRGPFRADKPVLVWDGERLVPGKKAVMRTERVSPFDVFPSPDSTTPHDGTYVIERMWLTADALMSLALLDDAEHYGVQRAAIESVLSEHPDGYKYGESSEPDDEADVTTEVPSTGDETDESRTYEVIVYYGRVRVEALRDFFEGRRNFYDHLAAKHVVEVECWVLADRVLRLIVNEDSILQRPLFTTSFLPRPGSFWGVSVPIILREIQRGANACLRSLVENMAYSSGPIGEYDVSRLENEEEIEQIEPRRMYAIKNDTYLNQVAAQPALRFYSIDSHARELLAVYDQFVKEADDATGIPAYVIGSPQVAGAGRTLGGLALLMGNAAKGVKRAVGQIDKHITEPIVRQAYAILMKYDPDVAAKADAVVKARGASGLLQREIQQARAVELLQLLTPYVQIGAVPVDVIQVLIREVVRNLGFSPDELRLPDPGRQEDIQRFLQAAQPQAGPAQAPQVNPTALPPELQALVGQGLAGAPPAPTLDQRQALPPEPGSEEKLPPV